MSYEGRNPYFEFPPLRFARICSKAVYGEVHLGLGQEQLLLLTRRDITHDIGCK